MGLVEEKRQKKLSERAEVGAKHTTKLEDRVPLNFNRKRSRDVLSAVLEKNLNDILGSEDTHVLDGSLLLHEVESKAAALEADAAKAILEAKLEDEEKTAEHRVETAAGTTRIQRGVRNSFQLQLTKLVGNP